jgi:hypothetical protein
MVHEAVSPLLARPAGVSEEASRWRQKQAKMLLFSILQEIL